MIVHMITENIYSTRVNTRLISENLNKNIRSKMMWAYMLLVELFKTNLVHSSQA